MNDEDFEKMILSSSTASSTATTGPSVTSGDLLRQMAEVLKHVKPEPLGEWMREQGYPPEDSTLWLPRTAEWIERVGPFAPRYVQFSPYLAAPLMTRDETLEAPR